MALPGLLLLQEPAQLAGVWAKAQETHACLGGERWISFQVPSGTHLHQLYPALASGWHESSGLHRRCLESRKSSVFQLRELAHREDGAGPQDRRPEGW